jgi:pentatricopeptide repeat protein
MLEKGLVPNAVTYTTFICTLCKEGRTQKALQLLKKNMAEDGLILTCIISIQIHGYCKKEKKQKSLWLCAEMVERDLRPDE